MHLGEVCILTGNVPRLAAWYRAEHVHRLHGGGRRQGICPRAVDGAEIIEPPVKRPWGAVNMRLRDPDGNIVYLRQLPDRT